MAAPVISEASWQAQVIELAELHGWSVMHVRRSKVRDDQWATATSIPGWPDLTMWRPTPAGDGDLIFAELKADRGRLTDDQSHVLGDLLAAGQEVHVWRPKDVDAVVERLTRRLALQQEATR